jgi:hypothetical protein
LVLGFQKLSAKDIAAEVDGTCGYEALFGGEDKEEQAFLNQHRSFGVVAFFDQKANCLERKQRKWQ